MTAPLPDPRGVPNSRLVAAAAYAGGLIAGVVVLFVEKRDRYVRFHAMQSVVTFTGVLIGYLALTGLPAIGGALGVPLKVAVVLLWIFLMLKAWQGESYKLPYIGDFAEHLLR